MFEYDCSIFGGHSRNGNVTSNTVNINVGNIKYYVYGGKYAKGNTVNINSGNVWLVEGGHSSGNVTDNTININGGSITGNISGGSSDVGNVTNNTINIYNSPNLIKATLYGGLLQMEE